MKTVTETTVPLADGKRRLLEAALKLAANGTGFGAMSIRELAREAKLNHNTFYRHFGDMEELAATVARQVANYIMLNMKKVRAESAKHADATVGAVNILLDIVNNDPSPYVIGLRELHGGSPGIREIMRKVLDDIAVESVAQISDMNLAPGLDKSAILAITRPVTYYMLYRAVESLDHPEKREQIAEEIIHFIRQQFLGAYGLQQLT
ncbi:MAG: TetR family transcriptional regulator [Nevskiales bacterium]